MGSYPLAKVTLKGFYPNKEGYPDPETHLFRFEIVVLGQFLCRFEEAATDHSFLTATTRAVQARSARLAPPWPQAPRLPNRALDG